MSEQEGPYRWYFEKLLGLLTGSGSREAIEEICQKILVHGHDILEPLVDFTTELPDHPTVAAFLELIAKIGDHRAAPLLVSYLESDLPALREQAAIGLGWLRARIGVEELDELEGTDPDEDVRREAQLALEEILREYPSYRSSLVYHTPMAITDHDVDGLPEAAYASLRPLTTEQRQSIAGRFPRLLALKYRAVPLGIEANSVVSFAVPADALPSTIAGDLERLTGFEIELHGWPRNRIFERLLAFYEWGDDDWVQFHESLTAEARKEITELVLDKIAPETPPAALPDCVDSLEAIHSFLTVCADPDVDSAMIERDDANSTFDVMIHHDSGESTRLDPPGGEVRKRFFAALKILSNLKEACESARMVSHGQIRHETAPPGRPFFINVTCERLGSREIMALEFHDPTDN